MSHISGLNFLLEHFRWCENEVRIPGEDIWYAVRKIHVNSIDVSITRVTQLRLSQHTILSDTQISSAWHNRRSSYSLLNMELVDSFVAVVLFHESTMITNLFETFQDLLALQDRDHQVNHFWCFYSSLIKHLKIVAAWKVLSSIRKICFFYERVVESSFFVVDDTNVFPTDLI